MSTNDNDQNAFLGHRCALLAAEGLAPTLLPGWEKSECSVALSPALGSRFALTLVSMQPDGRCAGNTGAQSYFLYLLEGSGSVFLGDKRHRLEPGSFAFVAPGHDMELNSTGRGTRFFVLQKPFRPLQGAAKLASFVSHEREAKPQAGAPPLEGVKTLPLLPLEPAYDFRVSLLTVSPGASLAQGHPAHESAFFVTRGKGVFRLNSQWGMARQGAVAWAAAFCPRWFAALGSSPCSMLACEDAHRDPI